MRKQLKSKKCRVCKEAFTPYSSLSVTCSIECAIEHTKDKAEKKLKRDIKLAKQVVRFDLKKRKEKLKSKSDWLREAQIAINKYVRLTDKGKPCCSCDKPDNGQHQRHASHYRSTAACSALRFNLKNIHTSCQQCNTSKSGNLLEYRIRLIDKYGAEYVDFLESQNQVVRYSIEYLKRLKKVFNKKVRMLEKRLNYN